MRDFLKEVPACHRMACDSSLAIELVKAGLGVAVVPCLVVIDEAICKLKMDGVEPLQARFIFPRGGAESLSEPAQSLVENIRKAADAGFQQETAETEKCVEDVALALVEETVTPMEGVLS
jgi:DNA-binding transcriptional LysR family regulator